MNEKKTTQKIKNTHSTAKKKHKIWRVARWILLGILLLMLAAAAIITAYFYPIYRAYKDSANEILMNMDEDTFRRSGNTYIYDKDDNLIGTIGNEKYNYASISDVSPYVINGYIAKEDKTFRTHNGVEIRALVRAGLALIENEGAITQGGSTITMQVVKNNLLSQEQTYSRKILEILLAWQLEKMYSKNQIMEFYVNSNYYGCGCYGIDGASWYYFGHSCSDLTLMEAAMLVTTSNSPSTINPAADYDTCIENAKSVLLEMLNEGYISQDEYDEALEEEPEVVEFSQESDADNYMISYAVHCATLRVMEDEGFNLEYTFTSSASYADYLEAYNKVYYETMANVRSGGYSLYTSFDTIIQEMLQQSVDAGLADFEDMQDNGMYAMQGAAVCIDNDTGYVIAMVGGRESKGSYNRGYQAERQPGSAIKPLLDYGPAINEGYITPATVINDHEIDHNGYSPSNSGGSYRGNVTVREALARSINTVAFQVFLDIGNETALDYLGQMQFSSLAYADETADAIAIGGFTNGVTPVDMARGYFTIENQGYYIEKDCLRKIVKENGDILYDAEPDDIEEDDEIENADKKSVYYEDTAFMLTDMMQGVFKEDYGTAHKADVDTQYYAGKTGTTNDNKDGWFCGYSAYYTTVVWCGYDTPTEVDGLNGNGYPLTIWLDFMNKLHDGLEKKDFPVPETIYLTNSKGETKNVDYTTDVWKSRPSGWDYTSGQLQAIADAIADQKQRQQAYDDALAAVEEFESWQIASYEDAIELDSRYNSVLDIIERLEDEDAKKDLRNRAAYKYELLSGTVADSWIDAEEVMARKKQEEVDAENEQAAAESLADAQNQLESANKKAKQANIDTVETYISDLNNAEYYSTYVESMISNAQTALAKCSEYSEYDSLKTRLNNAIAYAQSLPDINSQHSTTDTNDAGPVAAEDN